jgi:hypothetical protein
LITVLKPAPPRENELQNTRRMKRIETYVAASNENDPLESEGKPHPARHQKLAAPY